MARKLSGMALLRLLIVVVLVGAIGAHDDSTEGSPATPSQPTVPLSIHEKIAALEYQPSIQQGQLSAPNRAQGLRLRWPADGIEVETREGRERLAKLQTVAFGRGADLRVCGKAMATQEAGRVIRKWEGLTEWWLNTAEGVEEGWTVTQRPKGEGPLSIQVRVTSATAESVGREIRFRSETGRQLVYGDLKVVDARGESLRAHVRTASSGFVIEVDDADAEYPVTIDPLLTAAAWTAEANQPSSNFGYSAASAGDVNADGFSDVIVGAYDFDNGEADEGRAFLYLGSVSGLAASPSWTGESNQAGASFGFSVASAGDVNADGFSDVIISANAFDNGEPNEGRAFVYLGSLSGLSASPAWSAEPNQISANFGRSVASAGDVNGDGFSDVIIGASEFDNGETDEGRTFVYLGSAAGLSAAPSWTGESNQSNSRFGSSVASAGDVNGDGFSDVIIGAIYFDNGQTDEGRAFLYLGGAAGLSAVWAWSAESNQSDAWFGYSVASAGDVNGDGFADVIIGAQLFDNGEADEGRAFVYLGNSTVLSATPAWTGESNQITAYFGQSVASAGDVNGDGYSDVIVGAYTFDNGETNEGRVFLYLGGSAGLSGSSAWTVESNQVNAFFGVAVASAGDVNADGFSDVVVGAVGFDNGETDEGRAFVYLGFASGLTAAPAWTGESNQSGAKFGLSVATAGDVNADGFSDLIVGAANFDNGEIDEGRAFLYLGSASGPLATPAWTGEPNQAGASYGYSVASAGDVNGDGFSDVIVGAVFFDNQETDEGRTFLYLGSTVGLSSTPAWTAESNQTAAYFGHSVAGAGDVNGDGFADVVVGANAFDNGQVDEGRAFVYLGSAVGLSVTSSWSSESNQASAFLGRTVASAGDVNGDGYADVIVGASAFDNGQTDEGSAFVYFGSASGPSSMPSWSAESNQSFALFGRSVATAGDVNGDGFSDVIIGAHGFDNGQADEGRVFVYYGSATGLPVNPSWTAESDQAGAAYGWSVGSASDVNGDGYSDVIVGAQLFDNGQTDEGRAFLFLGSELGFSMTPAWVAESNQAMSGFGVSVAQAGDVNGDGFSDVIIGADKFGNGQTDEGSAFLYLGGDGAPGRARELSQRFAGVSLGPGARFAAPAQLGGRASNSFLTSLPRFRLEAEAKPLGARFTGRDTLFSPFSRPTNALAAAVSALPSGRYHWRARVVAGDGRGRWIPFGANFESEADFVVLSGATDAGATDAGTTDAGTTDAGTTDAGTTDAGAGPAAPAQLAVGCGCRSASGIEATLALTGLLATCIRRRARPGSRPSRSLFH